MEITPENPGEIRFGRTKVLEGHTNCVNSVAIKDNLIISGSRDDTIRIWDIDSGKCLKTLEDHIKCVSSVAIKDNLIISGSRDKTIRITPIILFPNELPKFQSVINKYWLPRHIEEEIMDLFKE